MIYGLHLYQATLDISSEEFDRLWQLLSVDERSRADKFKFEHLKRNFVAARGNLREILAQTLNCQPADIQFSYSDRGKPYIQNQQIYFNLAHSQNLAIYALCSDREVGIDVEYIKFKTDVDNIAQRYFSEAEQKLIQHLSNHPQEKYLAFYKAWVLKEAYGKATGQGIANVLDLDVASLLETPTNKVIEINGWMLKLIDTELDIQSGYVAAVCIASH
ncbi:4'-phosphopantetheinyl transferase superfamily protein [Pseudanabaena biceps]|nr:4'-phosphopantetheinyl transferase superfamily protein [Pseudanabaena biceps]